MMMMNSLNAAPLADITNSKVLQANTMANCGASPEARKPLFMLKQSPQSAGGLTPSPQQAASDPSARRYTHDPYGWRCLPDKAEAPLLLAERSELEAQQRQLRRAHQTIFVPEAFAMKEMPSLPSAISTPSATVSPAALPQTVTPAAAGALCKALVQFKCHQSEFSSPIAVDKGQYVVVQGDRGIDIGVVIRVNTDSSKSYVERTGPNGNIIRHATQREVDYWATDLKADEVIALDFCKERVAKLRLPMEVKHAEYQFDKKKLTFYYESKLRVDFVSMLKDLYREFGCRIWMERVRSSQSE